MDNISFCKNRVMNTSDFDAEQFVCLLTEAQPRIYQYVRTLLPGQTQASDVLQDVNLLLWRRANEFRLGTNFLAWARKIAYYEVLAFYRDKKREKLVFDAELIELMATKAESISDQQETRQSALKNCLSKLTENSRQLIQNRYDSNQSVQSIAESQNRSVGSISQALYRIRHQLLDCVTKSLSSES